MAVASAEMMAYAEDLRRNILSLMDKPTLDERCAELKARMLSAHQRNKGYNPARVPAMAAVSDHSKGAFSQVPKPIEALQLRSGIRIRW